jgi:hypothetical protein
MEAGLGKLLKFEVRKRSATARTAQAASGNAQILIFTGVRYERHAPLPPGSGIDNNGRKRKRG